MALMAERMMGADISFKYLDDCACNKPLTINCSLGGLIAKYWGCACVWQEGRGERGSREERGGEEAANFYL